MQEAKYAEDIVAQIKEDLQYRGFTNEHDRLGHFESVVPLDTIFALAAANHKVKLFALQFKAPKFSSTQISWRLTHPERQFIRLATEWHHFIWYCLPTYEELDKSPVALQNTRFVCAEGMANEERRILQSKEPLPQKFVSYLRSVLVFQEVDFLHELVTIINRTGIEALKAIITDYAKALEKADEYEAALAAKYQNSEIWNVRDQLQNQIDTLAREQGKSLSDILLTLTRLHATNYYGINEPDQVSLRAVLKPFEEATIAKYGERLKRIVGLERGPSNHLDWSRFYSRHDRQHELLAGTDPRPLLHQVLSLAENLGLKREWLDHYINRFRHTAILGDDVAAQTLDEWREKDFEFDLSLHVRLLAAKDKADNLRCSSRLEVQKLLLLKRPFLEKRHEMLETICSHSESWPSLNWADYFERVENCRNGVLLTPDVRSSLLENFSSMFSDDDPSLLVWCDFTARLCYTIETRRVVRGREGRLGIAQDPISAGLSAEFRAWVYQEAQRQGRSMSEILLEALSQYRAFLEQLNK